MTRFLLAALLLGLALAAPAYGDGGGIGKAAPIYWDTPEGHILRARMPPDADYWALSPNFTVQATQSYCGVATAVTVLNSLPIAKPVDPAYAPYAYFTQRNFFTPGVSRIISAQTAMSQGVTRDEMARALTSFGLHAHSIPGDTLTDTSLRELLKAALGNDGRFVLANYFRGTFGQVGGGHWSALAAYDAATDRVLILDVAKYKYAPGWVTLDALRQSLSTLDTTSGKPRGLVVVFR
jgi:hypothetical protein